MMQRHRIDGVLNMMATSSECKAPDRKAFSLVFAGTPDFAAYHLRALITAGYCPELVLTQPDRPAGRGRRLAPSPVKRVARCHELELFQPERLNDSADHYLQKMPQPDLLVVVAYGLLLPDWMLNWPRLGAINVHASLLPRWRGAAPIQRAIEAGDDYSGVGIMQMEAGLDTGALWAQRRVAIAADMSAQDLHDALQICGVEVLLTSLPDIIAQNRQPTPQSDQGITYAKKLSKAEAVIDWSQPVNTICRKIRAFNPVPVAHTLLLGDDDKPTHFSIFSAEPRAMMHDKPPGTVLSEDKNAIVVAGKDGVIGITELQEVGKKRLAVADFVNGHSLLGYCFQ